MISLSSVTISGFRGAPEPLIVDFCDRKGTPTSVILIGDNGTGKSTIVDAVEFALQARVGRQSSFNAPKSPRIASYAISRSAEVSVEFSDGSTASRTADLDEGKVVVRDRQPHPLFRLSPISIKRSDLLRFSEAARSDRLLQLLDFFDHGGPTGAPITPIANVDTLEKRRLTLKEQRRNLASDLADRLGMDVLSVPVGQEFEAFVRRYALEPTNQKSHPRVRRDLWPSVRSIRDVSKDIKAVEREIQRTAELSRRRLKEEAKLAPVRELISKAASTLSNSYREISCDDVVREILLQVSAETAVSLDVRVRISERLTCEPTRVLSEGKQDLLTLLLFVSLAIEAAQLGQPKVLVLDDALQSLSGELRVRFAEFLVRSLKGWQLIITVHDRLWAEQLRAIFRSAGVPLTEREIRSWSFRRGPLVSGSATGLRIATREAVTNASPDVICALAGRLLEEIVDVASCELRTSISRKRGDRYTLGDTWPGVLKELKKTVLKVAAEDVERWKPLRNLVGAHYNEWARSLTLDESRRFAIAVLALDEGLSCPKCGVIERAGTGGPAVVCRCGRESGSSR